MSTWEDQVLPGEVDAGTEDAHLGRDECTCPLNGPSGERPVYDLDEDCPVHG